VSGIDSPVELVPAGGGVVIADGSFPPRRALFGASQPPRDEVVLIIDDEFSGTPKTPLSGGEPWSYLQK
jgi:hypothetical protein